MGVDSSAVRVQAGAGGGTDISAVEGGHKRGYTGMYGMGKQSQSGSGGGKGGYAMSKQSEAAAGKTFDTDSDSDSRLDLISKP